MGSINTENMVRMTPIYYYTVCSGLKKWANMMAVFFLFFNKQNIINVYILRLFAIWDNINFFFKQRAAKKSKKNQEARNPKLKGILVRSNLSSRYRLKDFFMHPNGWQIMQYTHNQKVVHLVVQYTLFLLYYLFLSILWNANYFI